MAASTASTPASHGDARRGVTSIDDWLGLEVKTWRQLAACTYVAMAVFEKIDSAETRAALQEIEHILSPDWEGPQ